MHEIAKYILVLHAKSLSFVLPTWDNGIYIYGGIYVLCLCHILTHMKCLPQHIEGVHPYGVCDIPCDRFTMKRLSN